MIHKKRTREIIFRGQLRRKGEKVNMAGEPLPSIWKYGGIGQYGGGAVIYQEEPEIEKFPVYGDTVGQYTGLTDKNGVKVFEGDIVAGTEFSCKRIGVIVWIDTISGFGVRYKNRQDETAWENSSILKCISEGRRNEFAAEVIGNIYDNPELLTEEAMI